MTSRACSALLVALWAGSGVASAQSFEADVAPLLQASCLQCHGERTVTPLNLARLGFDLADHETFRTWERVYERLEKGEMPPAAAPRPEAALVETALGSLKRALVGANLAARGEQRTALRRLTRLEYSYTIQDLLGIDEEIANELSLTLPAEADSGGFDTVAAYQSMSPLHMRAYLAAADRALDVAIPVGPPPPVQSFEVQYAESETMYRNSLGEQAGAGIVLQLDDAYATFHAGASTYCCILHSESQGFEVFHPGRYRITVTAYPYQADTPVTLTMYRGACRGWPRRWTGSSGRGTWWATRPAPSSSRRSCTRATWSAPRWPMPTRRPATTPRAIPGRAGTSATTRVRASRSRP